MFAVFQAGLRITADLKNILEDPAIVKVMHDCRQDSAALYYQMGIKLRNIYDTQVAHGLAEFWKGAWGQYGHWQQRIGLANLLLLHNLPAHKSKQGVQDKMASNPRLWSERPIAEDLLQYAAEDVLQLLMLADKINADLCTCQLSLLSALSARHSQWCWDAAHRGSASALVTSFSSVVSTLDTGSWLGEITRMAGPATANAAPSGPSTPYAMSGVLLATNCFVKP